MRAYVAETTGRPSLPATSTTVDTPYASSPATGLLGAHVTPPPVPARPASPPPPDGVTAWLASDEAARNEGRWVVISSTGTLVMACFTPEAIPDAVMQDPDNTTLYVREANRQYAF